MRALIVSMIAALTLVACGGDAAAESKEVAEAPTTAPAPTQVVVEVTVAPIPTETPVPTPTTVPTVEPTVVLTDEISANYLAETKAQPEIEFPAAISKGAERLPADEVLQIWTDLLSGARQVAVGESTILEFCADGAGTWI